MTLKSMTGFARASGRREAASWNWEVRAVNGRGLDVRLRMPPGYDSLEATVRDAVAQRCNRGSLNITLSVKDEAAVETLHLNEAALSQIIAIAEKIHARVGGEKPNAATLMAQRGVFEFQAADPTSAATANGPAIMETFGEALAMLIENRAAEGARLADIIDKQLVEVTRLVDVVETSPARTPEAITRRLKEQLARVLGPDAPLLDADRLHQEAAIIATRADVDEELKRLTAHVAAARDLLAAEKPVGRPFDFLTQEFNREANTLCSKANDTAITRAGLDLKAVIDQMREQVQNIE